MTDPEPIYEFIKGQGWVTVNDNTVVIGTRTIRLPPENEFYIMWREDFIEFTKLIRPDYLIMSLRKGIPQLCNDNCSECDRSFFKYANRLNAVMSDPMQTDMDILTAARALWQAS